MSVSELDVVNLDFLLSPMDKGGELGDFVTTSDLEGVGPIRRIFGGISTELLRERDGVGGSLFDDCCI